MGCMHVQAQGRSSSPLHGLNPWPHQIPGFAAALQRYIQHMQGLGEALLRGIAMGLQLPPDTFLGDFAGQEGSYWVSRNILHHCGRSMLMICCAVMIACQEGVCWSVHIAQGSRVCGRPAVVHTAYAGLGEALLRGIAMGLQLLPDTFLGDFAGQEGSYWVSSYVSHAECSMLVFMVRCGMVGQHAAVASVRVLLTVVWAQSFICEVMGGGWSFAFTLIPRTGVQGHTNSLHRTHMGCLTWTVRAQVL
jgi:hypothetical protein